MNQIITTLHPDQIREYPDAKLDFMRFQVGHDEIRYAVYPVMLGGRVDGYHTSSDTVKVWRLVGWGDTLAKAKAMGDGNKR